MIGNKIERCVKKVKIKPSIWATTWQRQSVNLPIATDGLMCGGDNNITEKSQLNGLFVNQLTENLTSIKNGYLIHLLPPEWT